MQDFRDLQVWQKAHAVTLKLYQATGGFPRQELYGLVSQLRRAASSMGANMAEGCCRGATRILPASSKSRWVLPLKRSASYCSPAIWDTWTPGSTHNLSNRSRRSSACSPL